MSYLKLPLVNAISANDIIDGKVQTFADLPDPVSSTNQIWFVMSTTGVWLINRRSLGFYISDGSEWLLAPELSGYAPLVGATFIGPIEATNLSGSNSGDETEATILNKGIATSIFKPRNSLFYFEDFIHSVSSKYTTGDWTTSSINGGYNGVNTSDITGSGVVELDTGTSTGGGFLMRSLMHVPNLGKLTLEARVKITTLDSVNNSVYALFGSGSAISTILTNGMSFVYNGNSYGANWRCISVNSGSGTTITDSGTAVLADTWYVLGIELAADQSSIKFYINGSLVSTITTNIPVFDSRFWTTFKILQNSTATSNRQMNIDYVYLRQDFNSPR